MVIVGIRPILGHVEIMIQRDVKIQLTEKGCYNYRTNDCPISENVLC